MKAPFDLDGRQFSPIQNSEAGRVKGDAVFTFSQSGSDFTAVYSGDGIQDGHLIGRMDTADTAKLIYHSRAGDGALEAGEADATLSHDASGLIIINMNWRWLNGTKASGQSTYLERRR